MANLAHMPTITLGPALLTAFGAQWQINGQRLLRTAPNSSLDLGNTLDMAVGTAFADLVGGVPVVTPNQKALYPAAPDCVEVGPVRVVGGVRPQNFDVGYRPDGVRFAFDSKTLNDKKSVGKNWQNMVNDLATEATTVHSRFPYAVVGLMVAIPEPCLGNHGPAIVETLERLDGRVGIEEPHHTAESVALVVWAPATGEVSAQIPHADSSIRLERFSKKVELRYYERYKGLPPHR